MPAGLRRNTIAKIAGGTPALPDQSLESWWKIGRSFGIWL
jgi:hypothetical protein